MTVDFTEATSKAISRACDQTHLVRFLPLFQAVQIFIHVSGKHKARRDCQAAGLRDRRRSAFKITIALH